MWKKQLRETVTLDVTIEADAQDVLASDAGQWERVDS
jgi:hypothetical protein